MTALNLVELVITSGDAYRHKLQACSFPLCASLAANACCALCRAKCKQTCNLCPAPATSSPVYPSNVTLSPQSGESAVSAGLSNGATNCATSPVTSTPSNCTKYTWVTGQWSTCSSTCGPGVQKRTVSCMSYSPSLSLQNTADPAVCGEAVEPTNSTTCAALPCADEYIAACAVSPAPAALGRRLLWW